MKKFCEYFTLIAVAFFLILGFVSFIYLLLKLDIGDLVAYFVSIVFSVILWTIFVINEFDKSIKRFIRFD